MSENEVQSISYPIQISSCISLNLFQYHLHQFQSEIFHMIAKLHIILRSQSFFQIYSYLHSLILQLVCIANHNSLKNFEEIEEVQRDDFVLIFLQSSFNEFIIAICYLKSSFQQNLISSFYQLLNRENQVQIPL
jgi:hypothetical protein